jgi:carbonic anhydrase
VKKVYKAEEDDFNKIYSNIAGAEIHWVADTSKVYFEAGATNYFNSNLDVEVRKTTGHWQGAQFHWHSPSEHTIE